MYALGRYDEALQQYEKLLSSFPQNKEAKSLIAKCKLRIGEEKSGKYDWADIIAKAREAAPRLEVADYVGPISQSDDGLFRAKSDIKAGELLMCVKAFATLYPEDIKGERALVFDTTRRVLAQAEGRRMTQIVADKISANGSLAETLSPLQEGIKAYRDETNALDTIVDGHQVVDM